MATSSDNARPPDPANYEDYLPDDMADIFGLSSGGEQPTAAKNKRKRTDVTENLGIDEEVEVTKRVREPRVKLDESRLLSEKGIPALRKRARVLKLKGKGHEFSDAARLLSMYQLWLDDLFPKARFADALVMVEKEGHKASMHKMRMEWINESKPENRLNQDWDWTEPIEGFPSPEHDAQTDAQADQQPQLAPASRIPDEDQLSGDPKETQHIPVREGPEGPNKEPDEDEPDDVPNGDELEALMTETYNVPEDDELEALMAEAAAA